MWQSFNTALACRKLYSVHTMSSYQAVIPIFFNWCVLGRGCDIVDVAKFHPLVSNTSFVPNLRRIAAQIVFFLSH